VRQSLTPLARKYEKVIKIGIADAVEYSPMAKTFGLSEEIFPALAVHAPMNDNIFLYKQGKMIVAETVEAMLTTILQGKARPGQVFGEGAADIDIEGAEGIYGSRHDEL
jgi:protein disulfide-isomerase A1